jgi:hypothetical protein
MFIFPVHRLRPEAIKADVVAQVISGGTALNGFEDVIQTDGGGRWQIGFSGIQLNTVEKARLWDAWTSHLAGGTRQVLVPIYSLRTAPRPVAGNGLLRPSDLIDDNPVFPSSVAFASPYIIATTTEPAALRATTIWIAIAQGADIQPGMRCGIGRRSYKIENVAGSNCTIVPPLREAVADGTPVIFDWPVVQCTAVVGQDLSPEMRWGRQGAVGVSFVEDFS